MRVDLTPDGNIWSPIVTLDFYAVYVSVSICHGLMAGMSLARLRTFTLHTHNRIGNLELLIRMHWYYKLSRVNPTYSVRTKRRSRNHGFYVTMERWTVLTFFYRVAYSNRSTHQLQWILGIISCYRESISSVHEQSTASANPSSSSDHAIRDLIKTEDAHRPLDEFGENGDELACPLHCSMSVSSQEHLMSSCSGWTPRIG